jgi:hypothetical protein
MAKTFVVTEVFPEDVGSHVFRTEISQARIYDGPAHSPDLAHIFYLGVETDGIVRLVEFLTSVGNNFRIPKDKYTDANDIETWHYANGSTHYWEYRAQSADANGLLDYGDGNYILTVTYEGGGQAQTAMYFGVPGETDPIRQPTQRPNLTFPAHNAATSSPVTFAWEPCTDANATWLWLSLRKDATGEQIDVNLPVDDTNSDPIVLSEGIWEASLCFDNWYDYNNVDGIGVEVGKYSKSNCSFEVVNALAEMEVRQGGINIVDGQSTPIDFGTISKDSLAAELTFTIFNHGDLSLAIGTVEVGNNNGFEVSQQPDATVGPDGLTTFKIRMPTDTAGSKSADVQFGNSDEEELFNFSVTGTVTEVLSHIEIGGPAEINESSGAQYTCTAYYDDGSSVEVTSDANWSEDSAYANIDNSGYLTAMDVLSDQSCRITAAYRGKPATRDITIQATLPVSIKRCSVNAGRTRGKDRITIAGTCGATADDLLSANALQISISSADMPEPCILVFPVGDKHVKRGRYSSPMIKGEGRDAVKTWFKLDTKRGTFHLRGQNMDLTGLGSPLSMEIEVGDYWGAGAADEEIVNGRRATPVQFMMGVKDTLRVDNYRVRFGRRPSSDWLMIRGVFTVAEPIDENSNFVMVLGNEKFTVARSEFRTRRSREMCNRVDVGNGIVSAAFDFARCTFVINIRKADIAEDGLVDFGINFFGNSLVGEGQINLTGRR